MIRLTSLSEVAGSRTGINSKLPSSSVGMNSLPKPVKWRAIWGESRVVIERGKPKATSVALASSAAARPMTILRCVSAQSSTGS